MVASLKGERTWAEIYWVDGNFDVLPFDSLEAARKMAREACKAGRVRAIHLEIVGLGYVQCYRSRPEGQYQRSRGYRTVGFTAVPIWRG